MNQKSKINNSIYEVYGERWYTAYDDPVALLRAENRVKLPWIHERILSSNISNPLILDVGCGAGFLCNELALKGYKVFGIDTSLESLKVAQRFDSTKSVQYLKANAYQLPFESESLEVVTCLDFLEHVENPQAVIRECARVLKPSGLFFFHTFNKNFISWLVIIKAVELLVKNTPKDMHVIDLFIKPETLKKHCLESGIHVKELTGLRPKLRSLTLDSLFTGVVPESFEFKLTPSLLLSYMGMGKKKGPLGPQLL